MGNTFSQACCGGMNPEQIAKEVEEQRRANEDSSPLSRLGTQSMVVVPGRQFQLDYAHGELRVGGQRLYIHEDPDRRDGTGATVWDCGVVLAKYLESPDFKSTFDVKGKTCLELGSGTGIVGLAAALLGAKVYLSDLAENMPILEKNILANYANIARAGGNAKEVVIDWNFNGHGVREVCDIQQDFDYIFASDCIFNMKHVHPVVKTLHRVAGPKTTIFMSHKSRHDDVDDSMVEYLGAAFDDISEADYDECDPSYTSPRVAIFVVADPSHKAG